MRGPFDSMWRRWWEGKGHRAPGDAHAGPANGNGKANGNGAHPKNEFRGAVAREWTPWLDQLDQAGIPRKLNYPSTTLGSLIDQTTLRFGDVEAVIYGNIRWNFRQLHAKINRFAGALATLGVQKGERVVLTLPNCPEYVIAFYAVQKLGAVVVNAGPLMGADDLRTLLRLTTPRIVIGLDLQAPMLRLLAQESTVEHWVWVSLQGYQNVLKRAGYQFKLWQGRAKVEPATSETTMSRLLETAPAKPPTIAPEPTATAVLQPTSGTTGSLKLAKLSHRNIIANATQVAVWMTARPGQERVLAALPMFHVYGLMLGLVAPVMNASTMILETRFDVGECLELLSRHQPTIFPVVPAICSALCDELDRRGRPADFAALRICISGAAPLTQAVAERFERMTGAKLIEGYGLTEASPVTHANLVGKPRYGSIGLPMPDTRCRIADLDDETKDAAHGQPGELHIAGPQIMGGYFALPEDTARALRVDEQGTVWLRTGDIARVDDDGFFHIVDRKKDMIIRSGMKVYPAKPERVLRNHANVADVAVIGRPDPVHTERVVAVVVLKEAVADKPAMAAELRSLCREHLAPYEVPAEVEFVESIPRSVLGKVLKKKLREPAPTPAPSADRTPARITEKEVA